MSKSAAILMTLMLAANWGGFICLLRLALRREARRRTEETPS
jgi:hypothetical protein